MQFSVDQLLTIAIVILVSVSFHEAVHAFTAHWLGDPTAKDLGRITLNPFKHIDVYMSLLLPLLLIIARQSPIFAAKPVPFNPNRVKYEEWGAALVGISGPLSNFVLAAAGAGILRVFGLPTGFASVLLIFVEVNLSLFVFNMIPFPPLDGSRLLYAVAPEPLQRLMYQIESMGFFVLIFILLFLSPIISPLLFFVTDFFLRLLL